MSNRKDTICPHCGKKSGNYFEEIFSDDDLDSLEVLKDWTHPTEHYACKDGCERWTRQKWFFCCEHCGEGIDAEMIYVEPCDQNPYVVEMVWAKAKESVAGE